MIASSSCVYIFCELGHMFGQALAQWRAFSVLSSHQIFQAAFVFKDEASQQVFYSLLRGPAFAGCICYFSIASFTQVGFAAAHNHVKSDEGLPRLPLRLMARC